MNNFCRYLTPEEAVAFDRQHNPRSVSSIEYYKKRAKLNKTCCNCDEKVWRYGGGDMCFSCTTGESDASGDYELKEGL